MLSPLLFGVTELAPSRAQCSACELPRFGGGNDDPLSSCGKRIASAGGTDRNRMVKVMSLLLMIVVGACALNFIVYLAGTIVLGGEALNHGSVSNGHFTRATAAQKRLLWVSSSTAAGRRQRSRLRSLSLSQPSSALSSSGSMPTSPRVQDDRSSHNPPEFLRRLKRIRNHLSLGTVAER